MNKIIGLILITLLVFLAIPQAFAEEDVLILKLATFQQVMDYALKEGKDAVEIIPVRDPGGNVIETKFPYKLVRKAGVGESGMWTFYTLKYYTTIETVVVIVYKPQFGTVMIIRKDQDSHWAILEQDHSLVVWTMFIRQKVAEGFVEAFLKPIGDLVNNPDWKFSPTPEMRDDLCWEM